MKFDDVIAQIRDHLEAEGRVAYRMLKRRFEFDDDDIVAVKAELVDAKRIAMDAANFNDVSPTWLNEVVTLAISGCRHARGESRKPFAANRTPCDKFATQPRYRDLIDRRELAGAGS